MPFLYAGCGLLSPLIFPTAIASPSQCASPPPECHLVSQPLDQLPCPPNYQASACAAGCDRCGDEGAVLHKVPLKKLPRPRSSSIFVPCAVMDRRSHLQ
jgi:hypothetical protein